MATIVRPTKEGGATTYQGKVALGFKDILASEVDADLDTIYAAWNGGVDTVNIKNGAVTEAKLATDAHLWTTVTTTIQPVDTTKTVVVPGGTATSYLVGGAITAKARHRLYSTNVAEWSYNRADDSTQDDGTKPSWSTSFNASSASDVFNIARKAAGGGTFSTLLTLDNVGNLSLPGAGTSTQAIFGTSLAKSRINHASASDYVQLSYNYLGGVRDDTAKPAGYIYIQAATGSQALVYQVVSAAGALTTPLQLLGSGDIIISGNNATKATGSAWINPSDPRLKDDIASYAAGLSEICQLAPITYRLKAQPDGPLCYGFDASAVKDIFPECVSTTRMKLDPADEEETDDVLTFDMHPILVALVNAVKELAAKRNGAG